MIFADKTPARLPPGPTTPALWQTYLAVAKPLEYIRELLARYGDVSSFRTLSGRGISVSDPGLAREVFAAPPESFAVPFIAPSVFGREAVIATSGATHKRQRKLLNPHFHGARIKALLGTMSAVVYRRVAAVPRGEVIALTDLTRGIALDIILEAIFGDADEGAHVRGREILNEMVHAFSPSFLPSQRLHSRFFPPWRRYAEARAVFDVWVDGLIADRRRRGALGDDLLGLFLVTTYDDESARSSERVLANAMGDSEIRDQLVTLLLAGHETSATAIAWALYYLLKDPPTLARLRAEIGTNRSPEALVKNAYLGAVGSEALRIEPIVTDVMRVCAGRFQLREWTLEKGEAIAVMITGILRSARIYPEPDRFRPERFLEKSYTATEFLPFGGGSRRCLGAAFAESEMAIAIGTIASEWQLELADAEPERSVRHNITMGPARGVRVRFGRPTSASPSTTRQPSAASALR